MVPSIFTKIINGEIPSHTVYEDDNHIVILDIQPMQPGHCLVIPKKQTPYIWDMDDKDYKLLMDLVKKIGTNLRKIMDTKRTGILVDGSDVEHVHVHIIPFDKDMYKSRLSAGEPDHEKLAKLAIKIKESIPSFFETSNDPDKSSRDEEVSLSERSEPSGSAREETEAMRSTGLAGDSGILNKEGTNNV